MAKDFFHDHVKEALRKDGWNTIHLLIFDPGQKIVVKWIP